MTERRSSFDDLDQARQLGIGRLLLVARRDFLARSTQRMQAHGFAELSNAFVSVLPYISLQGTRSSELAQNAGLTKQAVAKVVKQLETDGLLRREADPADGRAFLVHLTPLGVERLQQTRIVAAEVENLYAEILGENEREHLRHLLLKIVRPDLEVAETSDI